jgi:hypothetical protein
MPQSINRWTTDIVGTPNERWPWIKQLVLNQLKVMEPHDEKLKEHHGENYADNIIPALIEQAGKTILPDLFHFVVADGPVVKFGYHTYRYESGDPVKVSTHPAGIEIPQVTRWGPKAAMEAGRDLSCIHHIKGERVIFDMLFEESFAQITRDVIATAMKAAEESGASVIPRTPTQSYWMHVSDEIERVSSLIHKKTMRGGANRIVTGSEGAALIETLPRFKKTETKGFASGPQHGGTLYGEKDQKWELYVDPFFPEHRILMMRSEDTTLDVGAVATLFNFPIHEVTQEFIKLGVRGAKELVAPQFYALIDTQ